MSAAPCRPSSSVEGFVLRPMRPADLPAARALWRSTEGVGMGPGDAPRELAAFLARNPGLSVVARTRGGALAGAVLGGHDGRRGFLYHLAVRRRHRGRGLGRALVDRCLEGLRATGVGKVSIMVFGDNEPGLSFWRGAGWRERPDLRVMQVSFDAPACPPAPRRGRSAC